MEHRVTVYYTFCPWETEVPGVYLQYQRKIANKMLSHGFKACFGIGFDKDKIEKGRKGKPYWMGEKGVSFNVSNTDGLVVCAISDCEVGVDAEKPRKIRPSLVRRCCSPGEIAYILDGKESFLEKTNEEMGELEWERFSRIWTLKESYVKMTGKGLGFPLCKAEFSIGDSTKDSLKGIYGGCDIRCSQPGFFVQRKVEDYWVSVCAKERAEVLWQELPKRWGLI